MYPFKNGYDVRSAVSYDISNSGETEYSETENYVTIRNIPMYAEKTTVSTAVMPELTITVVDNRVNITAVFPENAEECRIHLPWYPLYDVYTGNGKKKMIQYFQCGYYTDQGVVIDDISGELTLEDQMSRQASLWILTMAIIQILYLKEERLRKDISIIWLLWITTV